MAEYYRELMDMSKPYEFVDLNQPPIKTRAKKNTYYDNCNRISATQDQHQYVNKIQEEENEKLKDLLMNFDPLEPSTPYNGPLCGLFDIENSSSIADPSPEYDLRAKYNFTRSPSNLIIAGSEQEIIRVVEAYPVVVIQGPTGCGKTTQVPQYLLDYCMNESTPVNIVVTQPRRIATFSVAKRICDERNWPLGSVVGYKGYKVGMKASITADTRVTICTTGVLLQHLITKKHMNDFTHVVIDEVHERDQEMDFLLLIVRNMLRTCSPHVKVILMSATFDSEKFSKYFCYPVAEHIVNAPIINVDRKVQHLVDVHHLEDINKMLQLEGYTFPVNCEAYYSSEMCRLIIGLIQHLDQLEAQSKYPNRGAVLIFLPGIHEIEDTFEELMLVNKDDCKKWQILPLHSAITRDEQWLVFTPIPSTHRKIILSTNISESSVTVPDVKYVIDSCLTKQLLTNADTNISCLALTWASKVNCIQRMGRVGRVAPGTVFRVIPKQFYEELKEDQTPEMLRCSLSKLVLMAKELNCAEPKQLLGLALDPPKLHNIESTILNLKELGGLLLTSCGKINSTDGDITYLGRIMANLPIDVSLTRLIVFGQILGIYESALIIASAMYVRYLLCTPFRERLEAYISKMAWSNGCGSDSLAYLNAFKNWKHKKSSGYFDRNIFGATEEAWAKDFQVQLKSTREVADLIEELDGRLKKIGFVPKKVQETQKQLSSNQELLLLKIAIAGAFYPNYFVSYTKCDDREAVRALAGYDPYSTVYLSNFPLDQPGEIYTTAVKKLLVKCSNEMKVTFDGTSRIYIQFPKDDNIVLRASLPFDIGIPTQSALAVYKAVKMRLLRQKMTLNVLPHDKADKLRRKIELKSSGNQNRSMKNSVSKSSQMMVLPLLSTKFIRIRVTHVKNPSEFFVQMEDEQNLLMMSRLHDALNGDAADLRKLSEPLIIGKIYAASYLDEDGKRAYLRAKVTAILPSDTCKVMFVDYGNELIVRNKRVLEIAGAAAYKIPFLGLRCQLANIGPLDSSWSTEAINFFSQQVLGKFCIGEVYSVVESSVHLNLVCNSKIINNELLASGFATCSAESHLSRENHETREKCEELSANQIAVSYDDQYSSFHQVNAEEKDPEPPHPSNCTETVILKGPYSPLEIKLQQIIRGGKYTDTLIEQSSVNSVLLNDDPLGELERFVVAGNVHSSQDRSKVILRDTTVMPSVPGMLPIVTMLFAPKIELRTKPGEDHYTGMICGLGYNKKTKSPFYPEHDMELVFDTAFSLADLQEINRLRFWINFALAVEEGDSKPSNSLRDIATYQSEAQKILLGLFERDRQPLTPKHFAEAYKWNKLGKERKVFPGHTSLENTEIFSLHWGALPETKEARKYKRMKKAIEKLESLSMLPDLPDDSVDCRYCKTTLFSIDELREHLGSEMHEFVLQKLHQLERALNHN